jgi:AcrR family transcriptional regulator
MVEPERTPPRPLIEEQGELTRSRIRQAAMDVVARHGFHATVDEIARASGVSPRTIFRHYATQAGLILATVRDMFQAVGRRPIEGLPSPDEDLDGWLEVLAMTIHKRNAEIIGNAFWDLHAPDMEESETLGDVAALRRSARLSGVRSITSIAWRAAGGMGDPPSSLALAFALNFSTFATQALMIDFDQSPAQIGLLTAEILKLLLRQAVEAYGELGHTDLNGTT